MNDDALGTQQSNQVQERDANHVFVTTGGAYIPVKEP